jgi:5-methylcytosine-specific restriction endonuclease McrA
LDHKNGIPNDNRLENLRFLCPNCHSQTDTFSRRNSYRNAKSPAEISPPASI